MNETQREALKDVHVDIHSVGVIHEKKDEPFYKELAALREDLATLKEVLTARLNDLESGQRDAAEIQRRQTH